MAAPSVRLVQITDLHLRNPPGDIFSSGINTDDSLRQVLEAAGNDIRNADLLVATGDLAHEPDPAIYERLRKALNASGAPVRFIAGNHDDPDLLRAAFEGSAFSVNGDTQLTGWQLIFLDTSAANMVGGVLKVSELERLDRLLAESEARHAMLFLHHHPLPVGSEWMDAIALANADDFFRVVDRHSAVRAAVFGHVHQEFDSRRGGVRYLGTPSTCVQFKPGTLSSEADVLPPAWRLLKLFDDGSIETEVCYLPA